MTPGPAERLVALCTEKKLRVAVAESCTGGLIAAAITDIPGASAVFDFGFIAYANAAKTELLGVGQPLIATHGSVSEPVAKAMAQGAVLRGHADAAVAVTGIAGPGGGTPEKPVGLVFIATATRSGPAQSQAYHFPGQRNQVRNAAVAAALEMLYETVRQL